jgi:hypothetical protein
VPASFQICTWLVSTVLDMSEVQVVFWRLQRHSLQLGPPGAKGCLSGPHVPCGLGGQPGHQRCCDLDAPDYKSCCTDSH